MRVDDKRAQIILPDGRLFPDTVIAANELNEVLKHYFLYDSNVCYPIEVKIRSHQIDSSGVINRITTITGKRFNIVYEGSNVNDPEVAKGILTVNDVIVRKMNLEMGGVSNEFPDFRFEALEKINQYRFFNNDYIIIPCKIADGIEWDKIRYGMMIRLTGTVKVWLLSTWVKGGDFYLKEDKGADKIISLSIIPIHLNGSSKDSIRLQTYKFEE